MRAVILQSRRHGPLERRWARARLNQCGIFCVQRNPAAITKFRSPQHRSKSAQMLGGHSIRTQAKRPVPGHGCGDRRTHYSVGRFLQFMQRDKLCY